MKWIHLSMLGGFTACCFIGQSLFLYSPMLILLIRRRGVRWRKLPSLRIMPAIAALERRRGHMGNHAAGAQVLLYAKWWDWSGDDAWAAISYPGVMAGLLVVAATPLLSPRWRWHGASLPPPASS